MSHDKKIYYIYTYSSHFISLTRLAETSLTIFVLYYYIVFILFFNRKSYNTNDIEEKFREREKERISNRRRTLLKNLN